MKIAILGDFHLGYERFYEDSFVQCEEALLKAQERADLLLVAGDIFDSRTPKQETLARAFDIFSKIKKKVLVIHGTHERRPQGFVNPVELMCKVGLAENCHGRNVIFEKDGEKVAVYGLGGVPEEYAKAAIEKLAPRPVEGALNIFIFHQNLKEVMPVVEHGLTMEDLPQNFDLYVDGHIHKNYEIRKGGKHLIIPGSTVLTQIRGEESEKGFYLYDTVERKATFVTIVTRPLIHLTLTLEDNSSFKEKLANVLSKIDMSKKPIVRVDVESNKPMDVSELNSIKSLYSEKCYLYLNFSESEEYVFDEEGTFANQGQVSVRERGMLILKEILKKRNVIVENVEELFDVMCEGEDTEQREYFLRVSGNR